MNIIHNLLALLADALRREREAVTKHERDKHKQIAQACRERLKEKARRGKVGNGRGEQAQNGYYRK